jgi:hypothetical protein
VHAGDVPAGAAGAELAGEGAAMIGGEADFATQVFMRVVKRLLDAEEENKRHVAMQEQRNPKWMLLADLVKDEPEYEICRQPDGRVDFLDVAIAVLRKRQVCRICGRTQEWHDEANFFRPPEGQIHNFEPAPAREPK